MCAFRQRYRRNRHRRHNFHSREHERHFSSFPSLNLCPDSWSVIGGSRFWWHQSVRFHYRRPKLFQFAARYLGPELSFRQVALVMLETKELLGKGSTGSSSEGIVSSYAGLICVRSLQGIPELLQKSWAFSVAIYIATHKTIGYCNIHIRICYKSAVHDFHRLAIPLHDRDTGDSIFNTFSKAMDALYLDWRETIVGEPSNGEEKMTGRPLGVITGIQHVAQPGFMQVFCGTHKLDLWVQLFYLAFSNEFYSKFSLIVSYLRWHRNFKSGEQSHCPLICDTRWLNMVKVTIWFDKNRLALAECLEKNKSACIPDESFRDVLFVVHMIASIAFISF